MLYGILLAVFKLQDGGVVCLVQGFQKLRSQDGARPFVNECDCLPAGADQNHFLHIWEKRTPSSLSCPMNVLLAVAMRKH